MNELKNYEFHNQELLQELKNSGKLESDNAFEEVEKIFEFGILHFHFILLS